MKKRFIACLLGLASFAAFAALPAPDALPKNGDCPADYLAKGSECQPTKNARFAVAKSGNCPLAYVADGNYCVATPDAKLAIRRAAMSCPKGFLPIDDYCVSEK
jgi:hypothetical protein